VPEINLLPDELREKEEKELRAVRKKPRVVKIEMSKPSKEKTKPPLKTSRPSLLSRLFARKVKPAEPMPAEPGTTATKPDIPETKRITEKVLHIPKVKGAPAKPSFGLLADEIIVGEEEAPAAEELKPEEKVKAAKEIKLPPQKEKVEMEITKPKKEREKKKFGFKTLLNLESKMETSGSNLLEKLFSIPHRRL